MDSWSIDFLWNCSFASSYDIGVQLLSFHDAKSSMFSSPIDVNSSCWSVVLPLGSTILCVVDGLSENGIGVGKSPMPISSRRCSCDDVSWIVES